MLYVLVTAVGATMGPEQGQPEIACQGQLGGLITSGKWMNERMSGFYHNNEWFP